MENLRVAVIDNKIIGAACLETENFQELHSIAVYPDYRGKGIGRLLMDSFTVDMKEGTILFTRTTSPVFFEKVGFIRLDDSEKKELWDDCSKCNRFNNCKQSVLRLEINKR
ncbi:GNAT family N-acetyltransferase [Methanolobus sp. ZRKC5]|uniref:GNAT family N-acetyltransferase n=1 Tax=unclassified Methanolobus TaxID=2629569 RepID=UPI00313D7BFC